MNMRANFYKAVLSHFNLKSVLSDNNQLPHFLYFPAVLLTHKSDSVKTFITSRNFSQLYLRGGTGFIQRFSVFLSIKTLSSILGFGVPHCCHCSHLRVLHRLNETLTIYLRVKNALQRQLTFNSTNRFVCCPNIIGQYVYFNF